MYKIAYLLHYAKLFLVIDNNVWVFFPTMALTGRGYSRLPCSHGLFIAEWCSFDSLSETISQSSHDAALVSVIFKMSLLSWAHHPLATIFLICREHTLSILDVTNEGQLSLSDGTL